MARRQGRPKGTPKTGGRQKGTRNKATREIKELARALFERPAYLAMVRKKLDAGELPPAVWTLLLQYGYGRLPESINLQLTVPADQVNRMVAFMVETLKRHIKDRGLLAAIGFDLRPLLTGTSVDDRVEPHDVS